VNAGESFGFGVQSIDCSFGPGVLDVTGFVFAPDVWQDLGGALAGTQGLPLLIGQGALQPATTFTISLVHAKKFAPASLLLGVATLGVPFKGGVLVPDPSPPGLVLPLTTDDAGRIVLSGPWPAGMPSGLTLYLQYWIADLAAPQGWAASNGVSATLP
jgi:hypothetical protein